MSTATIDRRCLPFVLAMLASLFLSANAQAMNIWRCANLQYTNRDDYAIAHGCMLLTPQAPAPMPKPKPATLALKKTTEPFIVPVSLDGHFHMQGAVNGVAAEFLVDTGASMVLVSRGFARRAGLQGGGTPLTFHTPNGFMQGPSSAAWSSWPGPWKSMGSTLPWAPATIAWSCWVRAS